MAKGAENWGHQWESPATNKKKENKIGKKFEDAKRLASAGFVKAKAVAVVGAHKVKVGASTGFKFVKKQYEKRKSSK